MNTLLLLCFATLVFGQEQPTLFKTYQTDDFPPLPIPLPPPPLSTINNQPISFGDNAVISPDPFTNQQQPFQGPFNSILVVPQENTGANSNNAPIVQTMLGSVKGREMSGDVNGFFSIPYAESPRRFERTVPKHKWDGVFSATELGPHCMQDKAGWSENCLHLAILAPRRNSGPFPVLFMPHGGGFVVGGYNFYNISALIENFVSKNLILVLPNYRLGALGFWSTQTAEAPGNYGLWDLLTALVFVRQNIGAFGGDPNRITLWGQGSGAIATSALTLSPLAWGLYRNVILMSGTMFDPRMTQLEGRLALKYQNFAQVAGCDAAANRWKSGQKYKILECLQAKDAPQLLRAQKESDMNSSLIWHPTVDGPGGVLPENLENLARKRPVTPILIGNNQDETAWDILVAPTIMVLTQSDTAYGLDLPSDFELVNNREAVANQCEKFVNADTFSNPIGPRELCKLKFAAEPTTAQTGGDYWFRQAVRVGSSLCYHAPAMKEIAYELDKANENVYLYSFDYVRSQGTPKAWWDTVGAFHSLDLALTQNYFPHNIYKFQHTTADVQVQSLLINMIVNFAQSGRPSRQNSSAEWPPVIGYNYLSIDYPPKLDHYYHIEDVLFWNNFIPLLERLNTIKNNNANLTSLPMMLSDPGVNEGLRVLNWIQKLLPVGIMETYKLLPKTGE